MDITDGDVLAVYDVALSDRMARRHEARHAPDRWAERSREQQIAYDCLFLDGPGAI